MSGAVISTLCSAPPERRLNTLSGSSSGSAGIAFLDAIEELIARSEKLMRERISQIPDGTYRAEAYLDSNGHSA